MFQNVNHSFLFLKKFLTHVLNKYILLNIEVKNYWLLQGYSLMYSLSLTHLPHYSAPLAESTFHSCSNLNYANTA